MQWLDLSFDNDTKTCGYFGAGAEFPWYAGERFLKIFRLPAGEAHVTHRIAAFGNDALDQIQSVAHERFRDAQLHGRTDRQPIRASYRARRRRSRSR